MKASCLPSSPQRVVLNDCVFSLKRSWHFWQLLLWLWHLSLRSCNDNSRTEQKNLRETLLLCYTATAKISTFKGFCTSSFSGASGTAAKQGIPWRIVHLKLAIFSLHKRCLKITKKVSLFLFVSLVSLIWRVKTDMDRLHLWTLSLLDTIMLSNWISMSKCHLNFRTNNWQA